MGIDKKQIALEYGDYINKLIYRMIYNKALAEDASQQVWLEVLNSIDNFNGLSDIKTWIYKIASRVVLKISEKESVYSHEDIENFFSEKKEYHIDPTIEKELWVKEKCNNCVTSFLRCLNNEDRLALLLKDLLEFDYDTVAKITEKSSSTLRKQVSRSREKIRNYLNGECAIINTNGTCRCHIKEHVTEINIPEMYKKLEGACNECNELILLDKCLPSKNYWKKFIEPVT